VEAMGVVVTSTTLVTISEVVVDGKMFVASADTLAVAGICEMVIGEEVGGAVTPDVLPVSPAGTAVVLRGRVLKMGSTEDKDVVELLMLG